LATTNLSSILLTPPLPWRISESTQPSSCRMGWSPSRCRGAE
jgi:hypothetical protein